MGKKYLPSYKRVENPPPMRLTSRDVRIILEVYTHRVLSAPQIEALFFPSPKLRGCITSCQRRLQLLFHHGFLCRIDLPIKLGEGRAPYVYALDERGADLIATKRDIDRADVAWNSKHNQLGHQFVEHTLAVNDFRIAINLLSDAGHYSVKSWIGESDFRTVAMKDRVPYRMRGARVVRNYPDGYFRLSVPGVKRDAHFFLEVDQGTMSNANWREKVQAYHEFRLRGLSETHFGTRNFRLLSIVAGERRLPNLKRTTETAGGDHHFWFAAQDQVDIWQPSRLLEPIWEIATKSGKQKLIK